jgi:alpha-1,6-mannosyltransferase
MRPAKPQPQSAAQSAAQPAAAPSPRWHDARPWQTNAALLLIGAGMFALARQLVREYHHFTIGFSGVSGYSVVLYIAACLLILTGKVDRLTFPLILLVGLACRLVTLRAEPYLSSDIYRYVWDGIVQHAHINPYRYVPGDPALAFLPAPHQALFDHINRRDCARTIYPPAAQALFYIITAISPTILFMKSAMVVFEALTVWGLVKLLAALGRPREQVLLYWWCPLLIWEIAGSGHLDAVVMTFIVLALLARFHSKPVLTGLFLGLAVLTKLYPIVLLPALWQRRGASGSESTPGATWKMPATVVALIGLGYAAYSSVGLLVFGYLGGYVQEEGIATGTRYFLLEWAQLLPGFHALPIAAFYALCLAIFAALSFWAWRTSAQPAPAFLAPTFALAFALMLLFSPHYAWYIVWLIPFFCLMPNLVVLTYLTAFFYLYTTALAEPGPRMFLANEILYSAIAIAAIIQLVLRRWPVHRLLLTPPAAPPATSPVPRSTP